MQEQVQTESEPMDVSRFGLGLDVDLEEPSEEEESEVEAQDIEESDDDVASEEDDEVGLLSDSDEDEEIDAEEAEDDEEDEKEPETISDYKRKLKAAEKVSRRFQSEHDSLKAENDNLKTQMQSFAQEFQRYQQEQVQLAKSVDTEVDDDEYYEGSKVKKMLEAKSGQVNAVASQLQQLKLARSNWLSTQKDFEEVNKFFIDNQSKFQGVPTDEVGLYMASKYEKALADMEEMKKTHQKELKRLKKSKGKGGIPPVGSTNGRGSKVARAKAGQDSDFLSRWNSHFRKKGFLD